MNFVFDLDGTLIDSAPAIRYCLHAATTAVARECAARATQVPIGPPLTQMAAQILGESSTSRTQAFVDAFMRLYDTDGVARTRGFQGAAPALHALATRGACLAIITNKRELPTLRILASLGWSGLFFAVLCIDSEGVAGLDKSRRLATLLPALRAPACAMVGDTLDDYQAAACNGVGFVAADYGYEMDREAFAQLPAIMRLQVSEDLRQLAGLRPMAAQPPPTVVRIQADMDAS